MHFCGEAHGGRRRNGLRYVRDTYQRAVRNAFQVKKATSSHTKKQTVIIAEQDIAEQELKSVVAKAGCDVVSVSSELYEKKGKYYAYKFKEWSKKIRQR